MIKFDCQFPPIIYYHHKEILDWIKAELYQLENGRDLRQPYFRIGEKQYNLSALAVKTNINPNYRMHEFQLRFHRRHDMLSIECLNLNAIIDYAHHIERNNALPVAGSYETLEEIFYGRNRQTRTTHNSGSAGQSGRGTLWSFANQGSITFAQQAAYNAAIASRGGANASLAQIAQHWSQANNFVGIFDQLPVTDFEINPPDLTNFPITKSGKPSLREAFEGAFPQAELLVMQSYTKRQLAGQITEEMPWGAVAKGNTIIPGEITALRIWSVREHNLLGAAHRKNIWMPGERMEGDISRNGVFAFKDSPESLPYLYDYIRDMKKCRHTHIVLGTVKLWGEIMEHEFGYRAQYGKIASLDECAQVPLTTPEEHDYNPFVDEIEIRGRNVEYQNCPEMLKAFQKKYGVSSYA